MSNEESEEIKCLTQHLLASITWPIRTPKDNASFINEFAEHIKIKFNELSPNKYGGELQEFLNLRNIALSFLTENSFRDANALKALKKYYCQLDAIRSRFKECSATFSWKDSFGRGSQEGGLDFEVNNIIYNIAAIHNEVGSKTTKGSEDACSHFSNALWWVTELRDNRCGLKPKEMGHDLLTFFHHILQAQAQECKLMQAIRASMRPATVAKLAAQVANDYDIASKLASTPLYTDPLREIISGTSAFSTWKATVEFKHKYFSAMTQSLLGLANSDDNAKEIGTRITRLKYAAQLAEQCKKLVPDTVDSATTKSAFLILESLVKRKLEKAIRYNDNVYHSKIPSLETLPQPENFLAVVPIKFQQSVIPDFRDLFAGLVTIEAVQDSSLYSQKKDNLARQINTRVHKLDEELAQMLSTLNIDKKSLKAPTLEAPDELIEICAELSMHPNIVDDVLTKLEEIDDRSEEIQKMFESIQEMLKRRPNKQFEAELNNFKKTQDDALRTTQSLHKQLYPELQKKIQLMATTNDPLELLPKVNNSSSSDDEVIRRLEKLIGKVDEMKQQRAILVSRLKQDLYDDDVTDNVNAASPEQDLETLFANRLKIHDPLIAEINSNLNKQNDLLDALERANAQFGQVKLTYRAQKAAYSEQVESLKKYYAQFQATMDGIADGLKYHNKMIDLVTKFHAKVQASHDLNDLLN